MSQLLRGNFVPKKQIENGQPASENLEDRFEKEALKRLGGSICFVSKRKIIWDAEELHLGSDQASQ